MTDLSRKKENIARFQIIIVMLIFGTIGLFVKNIPLSPSEIALWRGTIAFFVLLIFMIFGGKIDEIGKIKNDLWKLFVSGAAMGFNWIFLFEAYNYTSVALSTLSYYFAPTIVILASSLLFKEKLSGKQIFCFLASTLGLVLIIGVSGGGNNDMIGILYGIGAAILYATVVLFNKATGNIDGITRTCIQFLSAIIVLIPYVYLTNGFHLREIDNFGIINLLVLGVFHTGIVYYFYFSTLSHLKGQQAAILSYIDPVVAVLLSVFILNESITTLQLIGGLMILAFTLINELPTRARKTN